MVRARPRILLFAGSIRGDSFNARLAALAAKAVAMRDAEATLLSLADYPMPIYNGDDEKQSGVPDAARRLSAQMVAHHGIFVVTPEYNQSLPALLKNTIDWVSRIRPEKGEPSPWTGRVWALGAASPGYYGGIRSLMHLRQILVGSLGCTVIPDQVSVPSAGTAFAADGALASERAQAQLEAVVGRLVEEAAQHAL